MTPMESNPFTLPSDEEVFRMRESEKQRKQQVCLRLWISMRL